MPVKKPAAAKKTVAKKGMQNISKQSAAAKKKTAATKKSAAPKGNPLDDFVERVCKAVASGTLDGHLGQLDDSLSARSQLLASQKRTAARKPPAAVKEEKTVSSPPKRAEKKVTVKPVKGKRYKVSASTKNIGGATVIFHNVTAKDDKKAVVEMATDKPGYPKGKRIRVPLVVLEEVPATKRAAAKKK